MNILIDDRFHCCVCGIRVKVPVKGDGYNLQDPNFFSEHAFLCFPCRKTKRGTELRLFGFQGSL